MHEIYHKIFPMKAEYYKNLYLYELRTQNPVEVFKMSIGKVKSYALLNAVVSELRTDDLAGFLDALAETTYDLSRSNVLDILYSHRLTHPVYQRFLALDLGPFSRPPPLIGAYNYCCYKKRRGCTAVDYVAGAGTTDNTVHLHDAGTPQNMPNGAEHGNPANTQQDITGNACQGIRISHSQINELGNLNINENNIVVFKGLKEDELNELKQVFRLICFNNRNNAILREYIRKNMKDDLLVSIMDRNGRVNASEHPHEDLLLLHPQQIYNLSDPAAARLYMCITNSINGRCAVCDNPVYAKIHSFHATDDSCSGKNDGCSSAAMGGGHAAGDKTARDGTVPVEASEAGKAPEYVFNWLSIADNIRKVEQYAENAIVEEDAEALCFFAGHCHALRTAKVLRGLLRMHLEHGKTDRKGHRDCNYKYNTIRRADDAEGRGGLIVRTVGLFSVTADIEGILISFLKAAEGSFPLCIALVPSIMKSKRLYFSCFAVMLNEFKRTENAYTKMRIRHLLHRYSYEFNSINDMAIEYYYSQLESSGSDRRDMPYLEDAFGGLAAMHGFSVSEFIHRNFFDIFIAVFARHRFFTDAFVAEHSKYLVVQKILAGGYDDQVNDIDVLVELLFRGHTDLGPYFRPSPREYIRANLSQLLFKIKCAYNSRPQGVCKACCAGCMDGVCAACHKNGAECTHRINDPEYRMKNQEAPNPQDRHTQEHAGGKAKPPENRIYQILRYVLNQVRIPLYFNYIWPFVEFFLNKEDCECAQHFIEWLRCEYCSPVMMLYMRVPFSSPEDLPLVNNIEKRLHTVLARYFSAGKQDASSMRNEDFIRKFLGLYRSNRIFRNKILRIYPGCPPGTAALLGNLKADCHEGRSAKCPANIPKFILESFLLRIDFNRQDLYSFVIQEFLKHIEEAFDPETESIIRQFRYTRYEYRDAGQHEDAAEIRTDSYKGFLTSVFYFLYAKIKGHEYLRHLVLFDNDVLECACLCLIKICHDTLEGFDLSGFPSGVENKDIARFMLKINAFAGATLCMIADYLGYALLLKDFHAIIYVLDGNIISSHETELLQLAYYMVGDIVRVRGINTLSSRYSPVALFFEFCIDGNFKAAQQCLDEIEEVGGCLSGAGGVSGVGGGASGTPSLNDMYNAKGIHNAQSMYNEIGIGSTKQADPLGHSDEFLLKNKTVIKFLREILENNRDWETVRARGSRFVYESMEYEDYRKHSGAYAHALMDYKLIKESESVAETVVVINARREIADNGEVILRIHRSMAELLQIPDFTRAVDLASVRALRMKKDYANCTRCIAKLILEKDWEALYEHALVKIDQKRISEAKELLRRLLALHKPGDDLYCRGAFKLCEISNSSLLFMQSIKALEQGDAYDAGDGVANNGVCDGRVDCVDINNLNSVNDAGRIDDASCIDNANTINSTSLQSKLSQHNKNFKYLQKIYFLAAKHFEKSNTMASLEFYYKSFNSNYEAVPRFFYLITDISKKELPRVEAIINSIVRHHLPTLVPYYNQISNRLSIQNESARLFQTVIRGLLESFPYETFWNTLVLINSKREDIRAKAQSLIDGLSLSNRLVFKNIQKIAEQFFLISRAKGKTIALSDFAIASLLPAAVNVPGQTTMIHGIRKDVFVFTSLQSPKKIILVGEDGVEYSMIVKYKDDLRKDSRIMDLDMLLNKLFDDGYYIRNYNVIPFTHDSGIIEYVPGLMSLKDICLRYYKNINETVLKFSKYKKIGGNNMQRICSLFKPIFLGHLKRHFSDPCSFFARRENYIKTYAIMNIVGWFIGLGDRHAENTHFDVKSGDTVHVDLNCIFDKGKTFEIPERVPFRLTQNIVDGFGCLGVEGTYKHTLRYTLCTMKGNRDAILANLLSFVFDPLFEWARKKNEPKRILDALGAKLDFEDEDELIDALIEEATDVNNLGNMYIGWMAFM